MIYVTLKDLVEQKIREIPEIKTVDWYNQQYENTEEDYARLYPAVYIEIADPSNWSDAGNKMQHGTVSIRLHVVDFNLKDDPVEVMQLDQKIFLKLHGNPLFDINGNQVATCLTRKTTDLVKRYNQLKIMRPVYVSEVFDISAMDQYAQANIVGFVIGS